MHPVLKRSSIYGLKKFLCLALITLSMLGTCFGQKSTPHAAALQESFRGTFQPEPNSDKGASISPSVIFVDSKDGKIYSIITQAFYRMVPRREYILNGIVIQKQLANTAASVDYMRLVQSAWPRMDSDALKHTAKKAADWIAKNPEKPLVLICSLSRADFPVGQRRDPIMMGSRIQEIELIKRVQPVYPQAAKNKHISGIVLMQVTIDEEGDVEEITPISGPPLLVPAAMAAVQEWKYSPMFINGNPVPIIGRVTVSFQLIF
jgi:TonB family protein